MTTEKLDARIEQLMNDKARVGAMSREQIIELAMSEFQVKHGRRAHMTRVIRLALDLVKLKETRYETV